MAQEQPLRFTKTSDKRQAPYPVGDEGDNHEPDRENEGEPEDELEHVARFHSNAEHELLERKSGRSVLCVHRREREGVFTDLALAGVAVVEPLEEAVLVHELDAAAAGARVAERVLVVAAVAADPAHVALLLVVVVVLRGGGGGGGGERLRLGLGRGEGGGGGRVDDLRHGWRWSAG